AKLSVFLTFSLVFSAVVVYVNYWVLLPVLIDQKKPVKYILSVLLLVAIMTLVPDMVRNFFAPEIDPRPRWQGLVLRPIVYFTLIGVSSTWRVFEDWVLDRKKDLERLENELRFLKNQVNPHFLFNALNNMYSLAYRQHPDTPKMIALLSEIMRYMLYDCTTRRVRLTKEIKLIEHYIALQNLTRDENLFVDFYFEGVATAHEIAPMLLINFVENAFKHSDIRENDRAWIKIELVVDENGKLQFCVENSKSPRGEHWENGGIGLKNTLRQLELNYPEKYDLHISEDDHCYVVRLTIQLQNDAL
ncbi:MAG: histidine kinase, partial [Bacteroidetes bacterium]